MLYSQEPARTRITHTAKLAYIMHSWCHSVRHALSNFHPALIIISLIQAKSFHASSKTSLQLILRWLDTVLKKNGYLRFRSVFLENYYLFEDKEYFCYVKQQLKSSSSFKKCAQLPLLWQQ